MLEIDDKTYSRREIIKASMWGILGSAVLPGFANASAIKMPDVGSFNVSFRNQHTGELFTGDYRVGSKYLSKTFKEINHVLRDFRTNEVFPIDPRVIDIIYMIRKKAGIKEPLEILSGYRCPNTNARLSLVSEGGVAKNSLHMTGQAIDFRIPGFSTRDVQKIAINLKAGGVGYYSKSNFVHVDTGRLRQW